MKQKINYKYVCLLMMLITVCLFGCSQTVMAAADGSIHNMRPFKRIQILCRSAEIPPYFQCEII